MNILNLGFLVIISSLIAGCGGGQSTASLEISKSFSVSNAHFGGGLIVYGENTQGKQFSFSIDDGFKKTISLENGTWTFYAIGWDGVSSKFTGNKFCGQKSYTISGDSTVTIDTSADTCTSASFQTQMELMPLKMSACGAFYQYAQQTNLFSEVNNLTPYNFCNNLPVDLRSPYTHAKIISLEKLTDKVSSRIASDCLPLDGYSSSVTFPGKKVPVEVRLYRSPQECADPAAKFQSHIFPKGLQEGNATSFDHLRFVESTTQRLVLPSGITRRGFSPFMSNAPRILCGTLGSYADCAPDITEAFHANVQWENVNSSGNKQTVIKNSKVATCPINPITSSDYFLAKDCEIKDGTLQLNLFRNEFTCHEDAQFSNIQDAYQKNGFTYFLRFGDRLDVYSSEGMSKDKFSVVSNAKRIAVSEDFIFVSTLDSIYKYNHVGYSSMPLGVTLPPNSEIYAIEVNENQNLLYIGYKDAANYFVVSYNLSTDAITGTQQVLSTGYITKLQLHNGKLYVGSKDATSLITLRREANGDIISGSPTAYDTVISNFGDFRAFHATGNKLYVISYDSGFNLKAYDTSVIPHTLLSTEPFASTEKILVVGDHLYDFSTGLKTYKLDNLAPMPIAKLPMAVPATNHCSENVTFTDGVKTQTLNLISKTNDMFNIFEEAYNIIGRQYFTKEVEASFIFRKNDDDDVNISGGGIVNDVFKDLSPNGISGIIPRSLGKSCSEILTSVSNGTYTKTDSIFDPYTNRVIAATISVTKVGETIPSYFCHPTDIGGTSCLPTDKFNLQIDYSVNSGSWDDKGRIKLACNGTRSVGTFERKEQETGSVEINRDLILWQTTDPSTARVEEYKFDKEGASFYGSVTRLEKKDPETLWARQISLYMDDSWTYGRATQLERTSNVIATKSTHLSADSMSFFNETHQVIPDNEGFDVLRARTSFKNQAASLALDTTTAPTLSSSTNSSYTFQYPASGSSDTTSKSIELKIDSFSDLDNGSSTLQQVFKIP